MPDPSSAHAPGPRRASITRGFLFADLRGYTSFVERHGAHRAASMLDRYRILVRSAVAELAGAEIRTEGDSFYVVFDGASSAIECGLAIVAAALEASETDSTNSIHVGIGIHAGETVETTEGFVGSAVNIAARICAQAGPNEVFVSGTVRALTEGVVEASFVPVGRRRLKGLSEPIQLYRAVAVGAPVPTLAPRAPIAALAGVIAVVAMLALAVFVLRPWAGGAERGLGASSAPSTLASALTLASASASASASGSSAVASADDLAFPTSGEAALLALVPETERDRCDRASPADLPEIRETVIAGVPAVVHVNRWPMSVSAGLACSLGGISAPDSVWYWTLTSRNEGDQWIAQQAGAIDAPAATCETTIPAVERWEFGEGAGRLLCYTSQTGDAIVVWNHDDSSLFGRAVRDDQDMNALLRWWADEARFGSAIP